MQSIVRKIQLQSDQEAEHIDVDVVNQQIKDAHEHRQCDVLFVVEAAEEAVDVSDQDENEAVEAEGTGVEKVHQKAGTESVDHPRQTAVQEAEGEGQDEQQVRGGGEKRDQRKHAGLNQEREPEGGDIKENTKTLLRLPLQWFKLR